MVKQDSVGVPVGINAHVSFFFWLVRHEGLDDEVAQFAAGRSDLLILVHAFGYPFLDFVKVFVYGNKSYR